MYGTEFTKVSIRSPFSSEFRFEIKRSEVNALDKPSQRCDSSKSEPTISKCVEEAIVEKDLNCSLIRLMSNPMLGICNDSKLLSNFQSTGARLEQFQQEGKTLVQEELYDPFWELNRLDEKEIFEITGCMPGCSKSVIELLLEYENNLIDDDKNVAKLSFVYPRGEYDLIEEYYIYNWGSFIADVGGYLGLLLGYSVLSMYQIIIPLLIKQVKEVSKKCSRDKVENLA